MIGSGDKREDGKWPGGRPHEEFLELSALSTSGEVSEQEQNGLQDHLSTCVNCRQALREFEAVADVGVPLLSSVLSTPPSDELVQEPFEAVEATLTHGPAEIEPAPLSSVPTEQRKGLIFAHRNGHARTQLNWNYVWMPFAAAVLLTVALGMYSYQVGRRRSIEVTQVRPNSAADTRVNALEQQMSDMGHEHEVLRTQLAERDRMIRDLRRQVGDESAALAEAKSAQANLEQSLQNDQTEKQQPTSLPDAEPAAAAIPLSRSPALSTRILCTTR